MLKKTMIFMMTMCLIISSASPAFANEAKEKNNLNSSQYIINDIETFKSEINSIEDVSTLSEEERSQILVKVNPDVIEEFVDEKIEVLQKEMDKRSMMLNKKSTEEIDLGDNCKVIVSTIDQEDNGMSSVTRSSTPGAETLWKSFGDRLYTIKYELRLAVINADLILVNHYTLSANGIDLRYGEAEVANPSFLGVNFGSIDAGGIVVHSNKARTIGSSIKISCIYSYSYTIPVTNAEISKSFKLYSNVKYSAIDLAEEEVKVVQSWSGTWL